MQITRVLLNNFAQHKFVDQNITENIVGIVGRNGSGKSNFATAVSIAISGEFGKKKKKDYITHGEKAGSIHVEGLIKSKPFTIKRSLNLNDCSLEYDGSVLDGADFVNAKLLELLGCDKAFLPNMVFVSQTDILGILFGRPSERNKMLQKFFGLEKAAKLELLLGQWKSNISYPAIIDEDQSRTAIENLEKIIQQNNKEIDTHKQEISALQEGIKGVTLDAIQKNYDNALEKEKLIDRLNTLTSKDLKYGEMQNNIVSPKHSEDDVEKELDQIDRLKSAASSLQKVIKLLESAKDCKNSCPICDSEITESSAQNMLQRLASAQDELEDLLLNIRAKEKEVKNKKAEISFYKSEISSYERSISETRKEILDIEKILIERPFPRFASSVYLEGVRNIVSSTSKIDSLNRQAEILQETNNQLILQISKHQKDIQAAQNVKSVFDNTKIHESRVSRIREVFRHDGISGAYVNNKMNLMCSSINQYLESFNAVYRVELGEDNEFICDFGNKKRPASDLSCGQKVTLSLAFRFSACEVFSTGVNLIVLDEPTTWLDKETIDNFQTIIESISELSDAQNLQVLIVTHERSLMPYFRQTIEF